MNSVRKSVRLLRDFSLSVGSGADPGKITRTVKLGAKVKPSDKVGIDYLETNVK